MLALYRKYRPQSLKDVIGQPQVTEPLTAALKSGKTSHSYLFTGPRGCGKTSVARILAHEINGFKYELEDSYLDIIEIDAASNTGVDNIRDLREKAMIAPSEGKYKVYIIDEVHMLSKSAFNALLKTLEEPPAHVIFILATTDLEKVPVTITSRSQVYTFRLASPEIMIPHLKTICEKEGIKIEDNALKLIVEKGGGSFRDSLSLLDQISTLSNDGSVITEDKIAECLGLPTESKITAILSAYTNGNKGVIVTELKNLLSEGLKPESIANSAMSRIIAKPTTELLPLLSELPKVSAPYSEAKLLLAFLSVSADSFEAHKENSRNFRADQKGEQSMADVTRSALRADNSVDEKTTTEYSKPKKMSTETPATLTPALKQQLNKCKIVETDTIIDIYPPKKIIKTILDRPANRDILKSNFNKEFVIHDPGDDKKSPEISKISDIMGAVQEVNNDSEGVPF